MADNVIYLLVYVCVCVCVCDRATDHYTARYSYICTLVLAVNVFLYISECLDTP